MVKYEWTASYDEDDVEYTLLRNRRVVANFCYVESMGCCRWWYVGPDGVDHNDNYAYADMCLADVMRMVMDAYGDAPEQVVAVDVITPRSRHGAYVGEVLEAAYEKIVVRNAADFRARREMVGISQQRLADELGIDVRTVKRWESGESGSITAEAWAVINFAVEQQNFVVEKALTAMDEVTEYHGLEPEEIPMIPLSYYRSQAHYDEYGRDKGDYAQANANSRAVAAVAEALGYSICFRYPDDNEFDALDRARATE